MLTLTASHITTPLADGVDANFTHLLLGHSALRPHTDPDGLLQPFFASLFDPRPTFCDLCIHAIRSALADTPVDPSDADTIFLVSTTKGDNLELFNSACRISRHFRNPNTPIVVSNACTSGVCAQIAAARLLDAGLYLHAIIVGCDIQTPFIVSGFQSFRALSDSLCMPFDAARRGLNVGEAAAALILSRNDSPSSGDWIYDSGSIHNDANHISGPSRTAEGSFRCLVDVLHGSPEGLAFINVHGTASLYNDDMESLAIHRAGLTNLPVNGLKGFYGHTMGAAGLLETIISMHALQHNTLLATRGLTSCGTSHPINVSPDNRPCHGNDFIKLLSGFGGCNAAVRWSLQR